MKIKINIIKLFNATYAISIKSRYGSRYTIDWGDNFSESFTGTGKPQKHSHNFAAYLTGQNYTVAIEASSNAITGIYMRDTATTIGNFISVRLANIDVSQCDSLEQLALPQFSGIEKLNLKGNPRLRNLSIECHSITTIDLTYNPKIEYLYLALCRNLKTLDLRNCPSLKVLDIVGTYSLQKLYLNEHAKLSRVALSSNSRIHFNAGQLMEIARRNNATIKFYYNSQLSQDTI